MGTLAKSNRLVVVADGAKALLLADTGIPPEPKLAVVETVVEPHDTTAAQGTERPGRVHESAGVSRSAVEETDFHTAAEIAFLKRLAARVDALVSAGEVRRLLLVAPPKALGTLRDALGVQARGLVDGELAKDLVKLPVDEIARHIAT
ncbi:host attachment protein [Xanthobacter agilis]|uniref:Protein required for attachment to host cells n=1 Tax=Xanthobacter agilis TaxID=47492 RepID=A0ABU0L9B7_XANAG|nr:host attachment protein [Xanthobacter agilis]MDQ0503719.1 protein required for attachment to host cells [Xanthobacter agilis]